MKKLLVMVILLCMAIPATTQGGPAVEATEYTSQGCSDIVGLCPITKF